VELGIGAQTTDQLNASGWNESCTSYQSVLSNLKATHGSAALSRSPKNKRKDKKKKLSKKKVSPPSLTLAQNKVTSGYAAKMRNAKDLSTKSSQDMAAIFGMKIEDVETTSVALKSAQPDLLGIAKPLLSSTSPTKIESEAVEKAATEGIIKDSSCRKKVKKNTKKRIRFEEQDQDDGISKSKPDSAAINALESNEKKSREKKKSKKNKKKRSKLEK